MPYITLTELNEYNNHHAVPVPGTALNQYSAKPIIPTRHLSRERQNFLYAYWNMQQYISTGNKTHFEEARQYFEAITNPYYEPEPYVDYRNQANLFLGNLWLQAANFNHNDLSEPYRCDPRQCAVKHYQQVQLTEKTRSADDGMMVILARQTISSLYADENSFPTTDEQIASPRIFKADHLRCIIAAIEVKATHDKFQSQFPHHSDFEQFAPAQDTHSFLNNYLSIADLQNKHLVFKPGLTDAQQYKIARACFDRNLITAESFHSVLRYIHANISHHNNKDDQQLRRNVKFYLASVSLQLYYQENQNYMMQQRYLADLTGIYNDLIGTKKSLYREALAQRKPKALEAQRLIGELIWNGSQRAPFIDPLTHAYEITVPIMNGVGTLVRIPFTILGLLLDIAPKIIMITAAILLECIALALGVSFIIPTLIIIVCCGRGLLSMLWTLLTLPLLAIGVLASVWGKDQDHGFWGQRVESRWLDTGFTFLLGALGQYLGMAMGILIGVVLSAVFYVPRLIVTGALNLARDDNEIATQPQIQAALASWDRDEPLALNIYKPPIDYLRQDKQYRNYRDDGSDQNTGVLKYDARFRLFGKAAPQPSSRPSAPTLEALGELYNQYEHNAPAFVPSYGSDR